MVRFENVGLRYGSGQEVLKDLNLTLETGSFSFLTGASGAGKTSLMRMLFLALKPTRGMVSLFGENTAALDRSRVPDMRRRIGVVFQEFRLLDHLTTFENVALPLHIRGGKLNAYRDNVMELLDWVGLENHANAYPPVLSGGEKQRAAIARAVISSPELLLADEPTGNVDPALALRLMKLFQQLNQFGTTVLIATHDTHILETIDAPVLQLKEGQINWQ
ncbi:MAG: cell division ATP-binding protein FtsE [Anderseniella sp.]